MVHFFILSSNRFSKSSTGKTGDIEATVSLINYFNMICCFSLSYVRVKWVYLGLGVLVGQNRQFDDITCEIENSDEHFKLFSDVF